MTPLKAFCTEIKNLKSKFDLDNKILNQIKRSTVRKLDQLEKNYAASLIETIKKTVPCAEQAQVLNWPEGTSVEDVDKGLMWVWLGFVKPGTHSIIVKDPLDRFFTQTLIVDSRKDHQDLSGMGRAKDQDTSRADLNDTSQ